ncbi:annexin A11 [Hyalella azteca]|uniref:Annexin A11 n=1 Tax=Hyalella azteca TaxID=294128 RepID=A0A8B7NDV1_HYAAZ|nr:annexin A11 [Hyalella azteca]
MTTNRIVIGLAVLVCHGGVQLSHADRVSSYAPPPARDYYNNYYDAYGNAAPNQRFFLGPVKGLLDKFDIFGLGKGNSLIPPFGCPPYGGGGYYQPPASSKGYPPYPPPSGPYPSRPDNYGPPAKPPGYAPPGPPAYDDHYNHHRPSDDPKTHYRPSHSTSRPVQDDKQMLNTRPHPLYG